MKTRLYPIAIPLIFALTACASDYTKSEAPNNLRVDGADTRIDISFVAGSARLAPGEAARLDRLVATGIIRPADRVTVAAAGAPGLAEQRAAGVSRTLLAYGNRRGHIAARNRTSQPRDRRDRALHTVTPAGLPELEQPARRRIYQCAHQQLGLRRGHQSRPDGGEPGRPRQRTDPSHRPTACPRSAPSSATSTIRSNRRRRPPPRPSRRRRPAAVTQAAAVERLLQERGPELSNEIIALRWRAQARTRRYPCRPPRADYHRPRAGCDPRAAIGRRAHRLRHARCRITAHSLGFGNRAFSSSILASRPHPSPRSVRRGRSAVPISNSSYSARFNDVALFRDLLSAGASDYLVKPPTREALAGVLERQSAAGTTPDGLGQVIVFMGSRGGIGATTSAVSCAWLLAAEHRERIALVDLDLSFGTVALKLDLDPGSGLCEALEQPSRIDSLFIERAMIKVTDTLRVLAAEASAAQHHTVDAGAIDMLLHELRRKFARVVVDLPRGASPLQRVVLATASHVVLVCIRSLAGLRDTIRLQTLVREQAPQARLCSSRRAWRANIPQSAKANSRKGSVNHSTRAFPTIRKRLVQQQFRPAAAPCGAAQPDCPRHPPADCAPRRSSAGRSETPGICVALAVVGFFKRPPTEDTLDARIAGFRRGVRCRLRARNPPAPVRDTAASARNSFHSLRPRLPPPSAYRCIGGGSPPSRRSEELLARLTAGTQPPSASASSAAASSPRSWTQRCRPISRAMGSSSDPIAPPRFDHRPAQGAARSQQATTGGR